MVVTEEMSSVKVRRRKRAQWLDDDMSVMVLALCGEMSFLMDNVSWVERRSWRSSIQLKY